MMTAPVLGTISGKKTQTQNSYLSFCLLMNIDYFIDLSWEETQWNVTGNVENGSVDVENELCAR